MDWKFAISMVITGLSVVFLVLLLLIISIKIIDFTVKTLFKKNSSPKKSGLEQHEEINEVLAIDESESTNAQSQEIIAVITAAVAQFSGEGLVIRSVKRSSDSRFIWKRAGIIQNELGF